MGSGGQSPPAPDAIGTLAGSRTPRDGLRRAKPACARRDRDPGRVPHPPRWAPAGKARLRPTRLAFAAAHAVVREAGGAQLGGAPQVAAVEDGRLAHEALQAL